MRRRAVEVEVVFFDVLAVIAFAIGQPEETLLEDRVFPVPEGERKTESLFLVRDAPETILAPAIGPRASMIVGEEIPGVTPRAIVLADGSPLTFAQVRAPLLPSLFVLASFFEAEMFSGLHSPPFLRETKLGCLCVNSDLSDVPNQCLPCSVAPRTEADEIALCNLGVR
jgi:hypothetical protein